jgi:ribonuclease E
VAATAVSEDAQRDLPAQAEPAAAVAEAPVAEQAAEAETQADAPAAPKPAAATGSLFFAADAQTPRSVTRHLFEPSPAPRVSDEQAPAQNDSHGGTTDSERSA